MIYFNQFIAKCRTCVLLYSKSSIGRALSDDINIETDNFDNGVYWITPSTLGNPSDSYGRLVKMDNYKMFVSIASLNGAQCGRELWVSIYVNSVWTPFNGFSDDATIVVGTEIPSGDDMNNYTTPGIYRSTSSAVTATLLHMPEIFTSGFAMLVFNMSLTANVQVIFAGDNMYMRFSNISGWRSWFKYSGTTISS